MCDPQAPRRRGRHRHRRVPRRPPRPDPSDLHHAEPSAAPSAPALAAHRRFTARIGLLLPPAQRGLVNAQRLGQLARRRARRPQLLSSAPAPPHEPPAALRRAVGPLAAIADFNAATFDFCSSVIIANLLARVRAHGGSPETCASGQDGPGRGLTDELGRAGARPRAGTAHRRREDRRLQGSRRPRRGGRPSARSERSTGQRRFCTYPRRRKRASCGGRGRGRRDLGGRLACAHPWAGREDILDPSCPVRRHLSGI